jgi:hypothetical protein
MGQAKEGGAFANTGAMLIEFVNCDFVSNAAGQGGAVSLVEGAVVTFTVRGGGGGGGLLCML